VTPAEFPEIPNYLTLVATENFLSYWHSSGVDENHGLPYDNIALFIVKKLTKQKV